RLAAEEGKVVLAEHLASKVTEQETDLEAEDLAVDGAHQFGGNGAIGGVTEEIEPIKGSKHGLESVDVGVDPIDAVEGEGTLRSVREPIAGVVADNGNAARHQLAVLGV